MTRYERRFRSVARSLSRLELMRSSMDELATLSEADLLDKNAGRRFLDFYGADGIRLAMERYGIEAALHRRGYEDLEIETHAHDDRHTLLVNGSAAGTTYRLVELVVRRDRLVPEAIPEMPALSADGYDVLTVDWLLLSHPLGELPDGRCLLPGQDHPGLGIGERVLELLYRMVERLRLDALATTADHFHTAMLYRREMPFWDPVHEGRVRALAGLLLEREQLTLAQASWALEWGYVRNAVDAVHTWTGEAQARAMVPELARWLTCAEREEIAARTASSTRYTLARAELDERWARQEAALRGLE